MGGKKKKKVSKLYGHCSSCLTIVRKDSGEWGLVIADLLLQWMEGKKTVENAKIYGHCPSCLNTVREEKESEKILVIADVFNCCEWKGKEQ